MNRKRSQLASIICYIIVSHSDAINYYIINNNNYRVEIVEYEDSLSSFQPPSSCA